MRCLKHICYLKVLTVCICLIACNDKHPKTNKIVYGNYIAEGNIKIDRDTSFEGLIKFFDPTTNKLQYEETYRTGIANGLSKTYYPNGKTKTELSFADGKELGFVNYYDSSGRLVNRNNMYYGIRMGPSIEYNKDALKSYNFYSFDNDLLFQLDYDSIFGRKITEFQKGFFYYLEYEVLNENDYYKSYLLYIINPPKYKFDYSLVLVDDHYNIKKVIQQFERDLVFTKFRTELNNKGLKYALELKVYDSVNDLTNVMLKVLD